MHCKNGNGRSAALCIAYMMTVYNSSFRKTYLLVKSKRKSVNLNDNFLGQLLEYQQQLDPEYDAEEEDEVITVSDRISKKETLPLSNLIIMKMSPTLASQCSDIMKKENWEGWNLFSEMKKEKYSYIYWIGLKRIIGELRENSHFMNILRRQLFQYLKNLITQTMSPFQQTPSKVNSSYLE